MFFNLPVQVLTSQRVAVDGQSILLRKFRPVDADVNIWPQRIIHELRSSCAHILPLLGADDDGVPHSRRASLHRWRSRRAHANCSENRQLVKHLSGSVDDAV